MYRTRKCFRLDACAMPVSSVPPRFPPSPSYSPRIPPAISLHLAFAPPPVTMSPLTTHPWATQRAVSRLQYPPPIVRSLFPHATLPIPFLSLQMHRRQTQNLAPPPAPQLLAHDPIHPRPDRLAPLPHQHHGVIIKTDHAPVGSLGFLCRAHDDGVSDVAASDFVRG